MEQEYQLEPEPTPFTCENCSEPLTRAETLPVSITGEGVQANICTYCAEALFDYEGPVPDEVHEDEQIAEPVDFRFIVLWSIAFVGWALAVGFTWTLALFVIMLLAYVAHQQETGQMDTPNYWKHRPD